MLRWHLEGDYEAAALHELGIEPRRTVRIGWAVAWSLATAAVVAASVVATLAVRSQSSFQSDDVAQVVALRSWSRHGFSTYYAGSNAYGLRFPIVWLVDAFTTTGKEQLYVLTCVLAGAGAAALAVAAWASRARGVAAVAGATAAAWVVSNQGVADAIGRPTVRNLELGFAALGLVLLDRCSVRPARRPLVVLPIAAAALALFFWNDPYFTLIVGPPALAFGLLSAALSRSLWRLGVAAAMAAGAAGARLLDAAGSVIGIDALQVPFRYPKPDVRPRAEKMLYEQLPFAMGTHTEGTGLPAEQVSANRAVVALLCVCGALALVWCLKRWRDLPTGTATAACMIVLPTLAWYASGNMLVDGRSWRYIMITPFVLPVLLVPAASALPSLARPLFLGVAALVIGHSAWINIGSARDAMDCGLDGRCVPIATGDVERQDVAYAVWLDNAGLEKVLVPYWHSNTSAYLSDERVQAVTVDCRDHRVVTWRWLTTEGRIDAPVSTSAIVLEGGGVLGCSAADITAQLGRPVSVSKYSDYQLWEYAGDVTERMGTRKG